jgi:hypothetical protein
VSRFRAATVTIVLKGSCGGALICFYSALLFIPLSITGSLLDKDLRAVEEAVGDRCGHSGVVKYFSPLGKRSIGRYDGRLSFMPGANDLEE